MTRPHILFPLLFLCLILLAFQAAATSSSTFPQTTTGSNFKITAAAYNYSGNAGDNTNNHKVKRNRKEALAYDYEQKKVRKTPSGPSPVGNNRPPSKA